MHHFRIERILCWAALIAAPVFAQSTYVQTNLVSDVPGLASHTDPNLSDAWGVAFAGPGPWWVNAANTGLSLVYDGTGAPYPSGSQLIVAVPPPGGEGPSVPTGIAYNATTSFPIAPNEPAIFLFGTATGTISGWNPAVDGTHAILKVTKPGAVYLSVTTGQMSGANFIYAGDFANGTVDVYDSNYAAVTLPAGAFTDPNIPHGFGPFNVQNIGGSIFVMYAESDGGEEVKGAGLGYVDKYSTSGVLQLSLQHGDWFNAPWGVAMAPIGFGPLSRDILIGQFGSGQVAGFNARTGKFDGLMMGAGNTPVTISGLWGIGFGNGSLAGSSRALYFAAGINDEANGLFGTLTPSGR